MLMFLVIGLIAGWAASTLVGGGRFGLIGYLIVGVIGSYIGGYLFEFLGYSISYGTVGDIIMATIGASVLLCVLRLFR